MTLRPRSSLVASAAMLAVGLLGAVGVGSSTVAPIAKQAAVAPAVRRRKKRPSLGRGPRGPNPHQWRSAKRARRRALMAAWCADGAHPNSGRQWRKLRKALRRLERAQRRAGGARVVA